MNRRILYSSLSIFSALALATGATFAFFSDEGTSSGNIFGAGTLDLELANEEGAPDDSVTATWSFPDLAPGETFDKDLFITNTGSIAADHIVLKFENTPFDLDVPPDNPFPMDHMIEITELSWDHDGDSGTPGITPAVNNANGNGYFDLDDLESTTFDNLAFSGDQGDPHVLRLAGRLRPGTDDEYQGDSVNMTLTVTMNQDASQ